MTKKDLKDFFLIIWFDGVNMGIRGSFSETFLDFDGDEEMAFLIAKHYERWINGEDI